LTYLGVAVALVAMAVYWPLSAASPVPRALAIDVVTIVFVAGLVAFAYRRSVSTWASWIPWTACGALVGAVAMGPLLIAPWLALSATAFAVTGVMIAPKRRLRLLRGLTIVMAAATFNFLLIYNGALGEDMRATPAEFGSTDFRVHSLLSDVAVHDVWVFHLNGGGEGRTLSDVQVAMADQSVAEVNTAVAGLVGVRMLLGRAFGWDDERHFDPSLSFVHRLTADDLALSQEEPGTSHGLFRTVYRFEREWLAEMMNVTAHAFFCMALEPSDDGYTLYWAIYVKDVGSVTKLYMSLIDPFRRLLVYPTSVGRLERKWAAEWSQEVSM
jgi:hypothetical protein